MTRAVAAQTCRDFARPRRARWLEEVFASALVGVGAAAQVIHIPALKKTEGSSWSRSCDRDPEKAARVAQKFQIPRAFGRLDELLEDDEVDAVDICTPNFLHAPMAIAALEAGKHVLCERPLARSAAEARGDGRRRRRRRTAC